MMVDERFRSEGLLVFDRLFDPALIERVRDTVQGWTGPIDPDRPPPHMSVGKRRLHMPVRLEGPLLDQNLLFNPLLDAILSALLGRDYVLDNLTVVTALPGAPMMKPHRDYQPLFPGDVDSAALPPYAVTLVIPLIPTDEETGTTSVARASMAAEDPCSNEERDWIAPDLLPGGAFLMDYRSLHRGLPNRSQRELPLLYAVFARNWFCDTENFNTHARMQIRRETFEVMPSAHRYRLRRVAAAGLIDATAEELGAAIGP